MLIIPVSLPQIADISSTSVVDTQQQHRQQQEGSQREDDGQLKKSMRRASVIIITLSFSPLDTTHIGYQPPLPPEEINPGNGGRGFTRERPGERGAISTRVGPVLMVCTSVVPGIFLLDTSGVIVHVSVFLSYYRVCGQFH